MMRIGLEAGERGAATGGGESGRERERERGTFKCILQNLPLVLVRQSCDLSIYMCI